MAKRQVKLTTTPRAIVAGYTALQTPSMNFNKDGKEYKITVAFEAEEAKSFVAQMEALRDEFYDQLIEEETDKKKRAALVKSCTKLDIGTEELDDDGEETGRILITFKQRATIFPKNGDPFDKKIGLFDSKGKAITAKLNIGSGSVVKVSFEAAPYFMASTKDVGVSFARMAGVQLIKYVEYTGSGPSAEGMGFEADDSEDGFDGSEFSSDDLDDEPEGEDDF